MRWLMAAAVLAAACTPAAPKLTEFTATDARIAPARPGAPITAAWVTVVSPVDDTIIGVSSPQARVVEMHEMVLDGDNMKMQQVTQMALTAGVPVKFEKGGLHLMVFDPLPTAPGATFPIIFQLKSGESKTVQFAVTP